MSKITLKCDWCSGDISRYPSQVKNKNFCSRECMNKYASKKFNPEGYKYRNFKMNSDRFKEMNLKLNPTRMTLETRTKLRVSRLGKGEGKTYEKTFGRHTHRVIAEQKIKRELIKGEVVHHIDGDKRNNSPNNLMVFSSQKEHGGMAANTEQGGGSNEV